MICSKRRSYGNLVSAGVASPVQKSREFFQGLSPCRFFLKKKMNSNREWNESGVSHLRRQNPRFCDGHSLVMITIEKIASAARKEHPCELC
jgi:hypothetical protein